MSAIFQTDPATPATPPLAPAGGYHPNLSARRLALLRAREMTWNLILAAGVVLSILLAGLSLVTMVVENHAAAAAVSSPAVPSRPETVRPEFVRPEFVTGVLPARSDLLSPPADSRMAALGAFGIEFDLSRPATPLSSPLSSPLSWHAVPGAALTGRAGLASLTFPAWLSGNYAVAVPRRHAAFAALLLVFLAMAGVTAGLWRRAGRKFAGLDGPPSHLVAT